MLSVQHNIRPSTLAASRPLTEDELSTNFVSQYIRPNDVPLAFHRESPSLTTGIRFYQTAAEKLEAYGRMLQYIFSDGLTLTGHQILYHPYSRHVSRHLLPLTININSRLQGRTPFMVDLGTKDMRSAWQDQSDQVIISALLAATRTARQERFTNAESDSDDEDMSPLKLFVSFDDDVSRDREVLLLEGIELGNEDWGPWRLTTDLAEPVSGVHYGRARLELDPIEVGDLHGLGRTFFIDLEKNQLIFHTFQDQIRRLESRIPKPPPSTPDPAAPQKEAEENGARSQLNPQTHPALETGVALHLSGHNNIQSSLAEVEELLEESGRRLPLYPGSIEIASDKIRPRLSITGDGSVKFTTFLESPTARYEIHGLPQSSAYLLLNLQYGLGATTGHSNTQIAHARRGLKRERDMKVLRSLGSSILIFFEAANFALGLPLSDGTKVKSADDVCESIFKRLGALIVKSEGWPTEGGSIRDLCSNNVVTLIEGFVKQVVGDVQGREINLYLPEGELKLKTLSCTIVQFFHALVSDLAEQTGGACFTRARTKYFENFMNGRATPDREDLAVRSEVDPQMAARYIYQPGIGERYLLPETSIPPRGTHLLSLLNDGFEISIDGKLIEEFEAKDFKPEFTLNEDLEPVPTGTNKINWFELHPKFFFKGVEITGEQASRLSKEGMIEFQGKLYRIRSDEFPSLKRLTQFWSSIQSGQAKLSSAKRRKTEETYYQLPRSQTLELLALRASGVKVQGGEKWKAICAFYDSLSVDRKPIELPPSFKASLQPYQSIGVQWIRDLYQLGLGGILADDMGLGKTVTSLGFLESLRVEDKMGPCLILVPTSLTYNWVSEAEKFTPELPITIFQSRDPETSLDFIQKNRHAAVVCTYGLLQEHSELFQQVEWGCIIFDEAQSLKNITTKRTTAARKLQAGFKLCLTGTPLENHYGEFYSLFDLIVPGSLGDLPSFREKFVNPPRVLREDLEYLRLKTRPLLLRRTKAQVMHMLPPKIETTIKLPFEDEQRRIYRDIATAYNEQIRTAISQQGEAKTQLQMLTALLRLRQACSDPSAIPGVQYSGEPPKITTLLEALEEITDSGESALVFTQFLATFDRIRQSLTRAKIRHFDISGADSRLSREKKLKAFLEEDGGAIMLMTLKTGGVGLNLTKASYIFHIEPWWNPAVENQATDRAHRMGQSKTVQVYRYLIRESVEEKIEILKETKSKRFDALFSDFEKETDIAKGASTLTQDDFEYLLS